MFIGAHVWNPIHKQKHIDNQRHAIRREFEPVGSTMFKNPLGACWGLLPTLRWVAPGFLPT